MKHNYYFLAPSFPKLILGQIPEIAFDELIYRLEMNLSSEDLEKVRILRLLIDLENIRAHYLKEPIDPRGNLSEKQLDEALLVQNLLPDYVFEFLDQFEEDSEKVAHFSGLLSRYYSEEITRAKKGFLKNLLILQREMRLVLTALRAKKTGRDVVQELQFEDFTDPLVAQILAQKDADDYDPPLDYQSLKTQVRACADDVWQQYVSVLQYEFDKIEEMTGYPLFSLDWILGFFAQFLLVDHMARLDQTAGKEQLEKYKVEII